MVGVEGHGLQADEDFRVGGDSIVADYNASQSFRASHLEPRMLKYLLHRDAGSRVHSHDSLE